MSRRIRYVVVLVTLLALVAAACDTADDTTTTAAPPEETTTTTTAPPETTTTVEPEPGVISFWSTETQAARLAKTQEIIDGFTEATGIRVQLVPVDEDALPQVMLTNAASGTLPEVVFHPLDFTIGWVNAGILDAAAAQQVVSDLGAETFSQGALALATGTEGVGAVPSDG